MKSKQKNFDRIRNRMVIARYYPQIKKSLYLTIKEHRLIKHT